MRRTKTRANASVVAAAMLALLGLAAACDERPRSKDAPAPAPAPAALPDAGALPAPTPSPAEACADRWLAERQLNPFGDPPDTNYLGGTPLFDERTGQKKSRLEHLFGKHPALKSACGGAGSK